MVSISLFLYNVFIKLYGWGIYIASFQNKKAALWIKGRRDLFSKIENDFKSISPATERIWMHCASLGEFEQGRTVLEGLRIQKPKAIIVLTFFSPSGYEIQKNYPHSDFIYYLPLDSKKNASRFINLIKPTIILFVKYEFWYHYFIKAGKSEARFILIAGIFRKSQAFFKWYGALYRRILASLSHIFVQDEQSLSLLKSIGFLNVTIAGDTRIDRVIDIVSHASELTDIEFFLNNQKAIVGGSLYDIENEMLFKAWEEKLLPGKIIIAPHNVDNENINKIMTTWGSLAIRFSELSLLQSPNKKVLVIDRIGILSRIYSYAALVIIGGGFGKGIHNILEPAVYGVPVLFGPNYHKFREANEMVETGAVFSFNDESGFRKLIKKLSNPEFAHSAGNKAKHYIESNSGGTRKILEWLHAG